MPLNLDDKKALVSEVSAVAARAQSLVAAEYRGLTVSEMTELRAKARGQGVYMPLRIQWRTWKPRTARASTAALSRAGEMNTLIV